jgi:hypothetical protein
VQYELFESLPDPTCEDGESSYVCRLCNKELPESFFYIRKDRSNYRIKSCKDCAKKEAKILKQMHEAAPPRTDHCQCCGKQKRPEELYLDHCHDTLVFRGWLCNGCNLGLGSLGDTVEALETALEYLRRHYDSIRY